MDPTRPFDAPWRRRLVRVCAVAAAVTSLASVGVATHGEGSGRHSHDGPVRVALGAVHQAQPSHFDASSVHLDWSCKICLTQSRHGERSRPVAHQPLRPPAAPHGVAVAGAVPERPRPRREASRAPPRAS